MVDNQHFCLKWNNHQSTLVSLFPSLLDTNTFVDCTLAAEGKQLRAHKVVLSACSTYFKVFTPLTLQPTLSANIPFLLP
jgi:broad-like protein